MNVQFTNEQLQILLENDNFRTEFIKQLVETITVNPYHNCKYSVLLDSLKGSLTKGLIRTSIAEDVELSVKIDEKVEQIIEKFVSRSIGKVVLKSLQERQNDR